MKRRIDKVAVANFLASLDGLSITDAFANARQDGRDYGWNYETQTAVSNGIAKHFASKRTLPALNTAEVVVNGWSQEQEQERGGVP